MVVKTKSNLDLPALIPLVQAGYESLADFDIHAGGDFKSYDVFVDGGDFAIDSGRCDDLVPFFQGVEQSTVLLCLFLLGADQEKIENAEHENQRDQIHNRRLPSTGPTGRCPPHRKS